ncbi:metal-dependent hydrolase [Emcibacter sp. SYSU 3D8]|uniref:metal-dependent hydrolase n=1 Tax=Emcibacter sp. SYSU 3D8 TaxID=3133969 RepID=UPI0031FEC891
MDNLAHTLAGAALGEAGLKKKTGLGMATLMIAANLPDLDVIGLFFGENLAWRRGWTHGPIALVLLPPVLVAIMVRFDRWQARRGRRPEDRLPVRSGWLLALAYVGILSHPLLDFLNTYGIRCLMPFSDRWFYGDALFIIDLFVWASLALGVWFARRRGRRGSAAAGRPAIAALMFVAAYSVAMGTASVAAERFVARDVAARGMGTPTVVLASPVPVDPFRRSIVFGTGDAYGFGELRWNPAPHLTLEPDLVPTNMKHPAIIRAARQEKRVADFLYWSRLPFAEIVRRPGQTEVTIGDARYNSLPSGRFTVRASVPD